MPSKQLLQDCIDLELWMGQTRHNTMHCKFVWKRKWSISGCQNILVSSNWGSRILSSKHTSWLTVWGDHERIITQHDKKWKAL